MISVDDFFKPPFFVFYIMNVGVNLRVDPQKINHTGQTQRFAPTAI